MLHIFAGAPSIRSTDKEDEEKKSKRKGYVWKTIHYDKHELCSSNNATCSLQLQYDYDAPMSDIHLEEGDESEVGCSGDAITVVEQNVDLGSKTPEAHTKKELHVGNQKRYSEGDERESCEHEAKICKIVEDVPDTRSKSKTIEPAPHHLGEESYSKLRDEMDYYDNDNHPNSRTVTDDLFREVTIHSQCLMVTSDTSQRTRSSKTEKCAGDYVSDFGSSASGPCASTACKSSHNSTIFSIQPTPCSTMHQGEINSRLLDEVDGDRVGKELDKGVAVELIQETPPEVMTEEENHKAQCTCGNSNSSSADGDKYSYTSSNIPSNNKRLSEVVSLMNAIESKDKLLDIVVVVLQTSPVKKILVKQGVNVGQTRDVSSVMVGDETKFYVDISLWGDCAYWVERLCVGDIVLLQNVSFHLYRKTISGRTTKNSRLYNFHRPQLPYPTNWDSIICMKKLQRFCRWLKRTHNFLNSPLITTTAHDSVVKVFDNLSCERLNHMQAKMVDLSIRDDKCDLYLFLGLRLPKVVVELQDKNSVSRTLFVWGTHHKYIEDLKKNMNKILRLTNVLQKVDRNSNTYTLHTSEKSDFKFLELEEQDVENQLCTVNYFQFERDSGTKIFLSSSNIRDCDDLSGLQYTGCTVCATPLSADSNQVYQRCRSCVNGSVADHFGMFTLNVKKVSHSTQRENTAASSSNMYGIVSDPKSFDVIVYPHKACQVFPQFFESRGRCDGADLRQCLKDEMESHLGGKVFNLSVEVVQDAGDTDSFALDKFVLVDISPT